MAGKINAVFYAKSYHPIQSGSIDGTDVLPHDNAVYRALLCSAAGLYDPFGDPKVIGDPYCTVFVGRLSRDTDEESLKKAMNRYGRVKNLRLVRDIVTGASRGYAFVEYETEREMRCAYEASICCASPPSWTLSRHLRRRFFAESESVMISLFRSVKLHQARADAIIQTTTMQTEGVTGYTWFGMRLCPWGEGITRYTWFSTRLCPWGEGEDINYHKERLQQELSQKVKTFLDAHHSIIDDSEIFVDYNRQQLMPGWIPRRLGGGLGGKKESGQLRFGGRERPFRAPLRPIPYDELKRLGISPPPEGRYISRFEIPSPPRRRGSSSRKERKYSPSRQRHDSPSRMKSRDREDASPRRSSSSMERVDSSHKHHRDIEYSRKEDSSSGKLRSEDRKEPYGRQRKSSTDRVDSSHKHRRVWENSQREDSPLGKRRSEDGEEPHGRHKKGSTDRVDSSHKRHREGEHLQREDSSSRKRSMVVEERRSSRDGDGSSHRYHRHYSDHSYGHQRSASEDHSS